MLRTLVILSLLGIGFACAGAQLLRLKDRTLYIDPRSDDLIYQGYVEVCKRPDARIFKGCSMVKKVFKYDLDDNQVRQDLINAGFRCQSPQRFRY